MKENDIRPKALFEKYLELGKKDIDTFFTGVELTPIQCPACGENGDFVFHKFKFNYEQCPHCKTLYISPRPKKEAFDNYYSNSESSSFWANEFYKVTEEQRRKKIWQPKALLVSKKLSLLKEIDHLVDIGGGYGIFIEEFIKINKNIKTLIIEPSQDLAKACINKGLNVKCDFFENIDSKDLPSTKTMYTSFELFEHLHDPSLFLSLLLAAMKENDVFLFTTLNGMGVDIQALWENSNSLSPPHHLNFFNPKSIQKLLEDIGFTIIEITTPGKLDLDIMRNNQSLLKDNFWKNFLDYATEIEQEHMQNFLSENLLSSHMMVICKKGEI